MKYITDKNGYRAIFDEETGCTVRDESRIQGLAWKMSGPELLDISITNYCERGCDFCYRHSGKSGDFMSVELFENIISQAKALGVFQVALGGGNPNQHPQFIEFLKIAKSNGIIPSYTTNGQGMTDEIYRASRQYCGAVAISWYKPYDEAINVINNCWKYKIPVNIHFVLGADSLLEARNLLNQELLNKVNAVIFLNYKPVGAVKRKILHKSEQLDTFIYEAVHFTRCKIGFDSCMISHLARNKEYIRDESVDYCEAARFSAFISEHGVMYPCSFMCGADMKGYNLNDFSIKEIWQDSAEFTRIRKLLDTKGERCLECKEYKFCRGGCPCFLINC